MTAVRAGRLRPRLGILLVSVCLLVLSACGRSHDSSGPAAAPTSAGAAPAATKQVAEVTWNLPGEPASLDPVKVFTARDMWVSSNVCESLLEYQPDGSIGPGLATSIDTPNPTTYVVHLRPHVAFSDGKPMTATDVVYSLDRVMDPKSGSFWSQFASHVRSVTSADPSTVTIRLSQPDVIFYRMLGTPMGQVVEKAYAEKAGAQLGSSSGGIVCTGPYTLASWKKGQSITLQANDHWWNVGSHPLLTRKVTFTFVASDSTLAAGLTNGDIDGSYTVPSGAALTKLTQSDTGTLYTGPSTAQLVLIPTDVAGDGPLGNVKVRQALAKSIDYNGILSTLMPHTGAPLRAVVPPGAFGYARDTYQKAYDAFADPALDIAGAKKLLQRAHDLHPTLTFAFPSSQDLSVNMAEAIQSSAKAAGFNIVLKPLADAQFFALFSSAKARAKYDMFLTDWYADIPEPLELYLGMTTPGNSINMSDYDDQTVTQLLQKANVTPDDEQRAQLVVQAQATITHDEAWIPLAYELGTLYLNNKLGGATSASPYNIYAPWLATLGGR
jgi:peptide/nickel transport system substrate-binding protein